MKQLRESKKIGRAVELHLVAPSNVTDYNVVLNFSPRLFSFSLYVLIFREKELIDEQVNDLATTKGRLKIRITELEHEVKKYNFCSSNSVGGKFVISFPIDVVCLRQTEDFSGSLL